MCLSLCRKPRSPMPVNRGLVEFSGPRSWEQLSSHCLGGTRRSLQMKNRGPGSQEMSKLCLVQVTPRLLRPGLQTATCKQERTTSDIMPQSCLSNLYNIQDSVLWMYHMVEWSRVRRGSRVSHTSCREDNKMKKNRRATAELEDYFLCG
ncbi:uncharacterized protein LOC112583634 isoform X4 [Bubalus bubalis]|uniref:uncharacterized protein LOC112583634 isoform X4 n=1 Tax=Bubalus bubalis TaxID=89462 RepID=UPI001D0FBB2B|nr:uncharacterized protein LOC112583634 isoform X4 [Bubalus bubalis]